jgi:YgiT-type zinc finger domain-containing protein
MKKEDVTFVYDECDDYLVVEHVPAEVCTKCGERTYSPEVTDELLKFAKKEFKPVKTINVPVFDFSEASST